MANRTITLTLKAQVDGFVNGLKTAQKATTDTAKGLADFQKNHQQHYQQIQSVATKTGAALLAASVMAGKAAVDWQSSWAGVTKTNEGTSEQMVKLEDDLRSLARTLPTSHSEIAATAEAAGQLGVAVDDVSLFTETMIHMGETTNMSSEEAATGLARFSNITGTAWADVDRLGSTIVALGNNFATTESEILAMATRVSAAGTQAGLTEAEILGLSAAMSSVGIEAEAGGTAITQTLNNIDKSVRESGDRLQDWADIAGVSAKEFADTWRNEPAEAFELVVKGLARVQEQGGSVAGTLENLGISGIRQADMMRRLASAGEILGDAFTMGNQAFAENSALIEEATQRYETAESKVKIAWNNIVDAAIDAGAVLLPVISGVAETVATVAQAFGALPQPVKAGLTIFSGVAGVTLLAAAGFMRVFNSVMDTRAAFTQLKASAPGAVSGISAVGNAARRLAVNAIAAHAALTLISSFSADMREQVGDVNHFAQAMNKLQGDAEGAGARINELAASTSWLGGEVKDLGGMFDALDVGGWERFFKSPLGALGFLTDAVDGAEQAIGNMDMAMESLISSGNAEAAAQGFQVLADAAGDRPLEEWTKDLPQLEAALYNAGISMEEFARAAKTGDVSDIMLKLSAASAEAEGGLGGASDALADLGDEAADAAGSLDDLLSSLTSLGLMERDAAAAARAYQEAVESLTSSIADNGATLDITTQAGRDNESALHDLAQATLDSAAAAAENGAGQKELQDILVGGAGAFQKFAEQLTGSSEKAAELTRTMFEIPDDVSIESFMSDQAEIVAAQTALAVEEIPEAKDVHVAVSEDGTAGMVQVLVDDITGNEVYMFVTDDGTVVEVQKDIREIEGKDVPVYVDDNGTVYRTQAAIDGVRGKSVTITAGAATAVAEGQLNYAARPRIARITASVVGGVGAALAGRADGGRAPSNALPRYSTGGKLPDTGLGTDQILGINSRGTPIAWVDDREWIITKRMSDKYDRALSMINQDHPAVQHLANYRDGGLPRGWGAVSPMHAISSAASHSPAVDAAVIASAVASAVKGFRPVVEIGGREFYGVMQETQRRFGGR